MSGADISWWGAPVVASSTPFLSHCGVFALVRASSPSQLAETPGQSPPRIAFDKRPAKARTVPLMMTVFVPTGGHERTVSSVADSRTPSPGLINCAPKAKREASPLVINARGPPPALNGVSKPVASSSLKAPRFPSPNCRNGVYKNDLPPHKPLPIPPHSSSPSITTNGMHHPPPLSSSPPSSPGVYAPCPRPVTGRRDPQLASGCTPALCLRCADVAFSIPSAPPRQLRSYQTQLHRAPPSAPKALREAQNPNAVAAQALALGVVRAEAVQWARLPAELQTRPHASGPTGGSTAVGAGMDDSFPFCLFLLG
ncbi:hypothetical protein C8R44DRAFT_980645 [Mycena epipterygia]|nr:hypothetical protein C8R44DRAFT_980645 [Mycena epipterygia]